MTEHHVVLGASGGTGAAMVRELARVGRQVRAITRTGRTDAADGVQPAAADLATRDGARSACEGAAVVYHCAQPDYTKWPELFPAMTRNVIEACAEADAKLVFADNLYMYGPPDGPMTEDTPLGAQGPKGRTRIEMASDLLDAHRAGRVRVAIGRSSDYYGAGGRASTAGDNVFKPALRERKARWLGSLDEPHTLGYLDDMARAFVTLADRPQADGEVWHLPAAEALTGRQFLELVFEAAGQRPRVGVAPRWMIRLAGLVSPRLRELNETLYQFERPFISDASKFRAAFGPFEPTPHPNAIERTVEWFKRHDD